MSRLKRFIRKLFTLEPKRIEKKRIEKKRIEPIRLNTIYSNSDPDSVRRLNDWLDYVKDKHHG